MLNRAEARLLGEHADEESVRRNTSASLLGQAIVDRDSFRAAPRARTRAGAPPTTGTSRARGRRPSAASLGDARYLGPSARPSIASLGRLIVPLLANVHEARAAASGLRAQADGSVGHGGPPQSLHAAPQARRGAASSAAAGAGAVRRSRSDGESTELAELNESLEDMEAVAGHLVRELGSLELELDETVGLDAEPRSCELASIFEAAGRLSEHATRQAGGVRWPVMPAATAVGNPRGTKIAVLSAVMSCLAEQLFGRDDGIDVWVDARRRNRVLVWLGSPALDAATIEACHRVLPDPAELDPGLALQVFEGRLVLEVCR